MAIPSRSVSHSAAEPTLEEVWGRVRNFYRTSATCERVRVGVRVGDGPTARQSITIRTLPATAPDSRPLLWIKAGELNIELNGLRLRLGVQRPQKLWFEQTGDDALLLIHGTLPPLPLPQLDLLLLPDNQPLQNLSLYAKEVRWDSVEFDRAGAAAGAIGAGNGGGDGTGGRGLATLKGRHTLGEIELLANVLSGAIRRVQIRHDGEPPTTIVLECSAISPSTPLFEIDTDPADRVGSIAMLLQAIRPVAIEPPTFDFAMLTDLGGLPVEPPRSVIDGRSTRRPCVVAAIAWQQTEPANAAESIGLDEARRFLRATLSAMGDPASDGANPALVVVAIVPQRTESSSASPESGAGSEAESEAAPDGAARKRLRAFVDSLGPDQPEAVAMLPISAWPRWASGDGAAFVIVVVDAHGRASAVIPSSMEHAQDGSLKREIIDALGDQAPSPAPAQSK